MDYRYLADCTTIIRRALDISEEQLASAIRKSSFMVRRWEAGRGTPSLVDIAAMCQHYFKDGDYLPFLGNGRSRLVLEAYGDQNSLSYHPHFSARIREEMKASQLRLGKLLGVSNTTIHRWEAGNLQPSLERVAGMANLYFANHSEPLSLLSNSCGGVLLQTETNLRV